MEKMQKTKIKICGLRIPSDVEVVNQVKPEMIGFIFDPTRRRYVDPTIAEELRQQLKPGIESVGVFVNASVEEILEVLKICHVDWIQLHGQESNEFIEELRRAFSSILENENSLSLPLDSLSNKKVRIIKAFKIDGAADLELAAASAADLVLLDHGIGGTGESFDWSLIRNFAKVRPFMLAGGLTPENVGQAIQLAQPYAVDASSSLETEGHKDLTKAEAFVQAVRG